MTRLTTFLLFLVLTLSASAQRLTVESFVAAPMDLSAAAKPVSDLNGKACALVKVRVAADGATFEGSIVKTVKNNASEYWVYMTEGTYMLTVSCPGFLPLDINFRDYGVRRVMSKQTYVLTLLRPDAVHAAASASNNPTFTPSSSRVPVPEAVDLGLSVKWASFNLGASRPEETGNYYKWGETEPAHDLSWATYKYAMGDRDKLTKYCIDSQHGNNGFLDAKTKLEAEDDAATVNLGGGWRTPTKEEVQELIERCKHEWTAVGDVNGTMFTASNGNTIFFPATDRTFNFDGTVSNKGTKCNYWSASLYNSLRDLHYGNADSSYAYSSWFSESYFGPAKCDRTFDFPIRPVLGK